ncbi:hypothetical protein GOV14_03460 [Candidatus Pacearchaeota archaeon]|nr:hypothetical protein [Candidatus Pacearchaeota archaeon]
MQNSLEEDSTEIAVRGIASVLLGPKPEEFIFERIGQGFCDLMQARYGPAKQIVKGTFVDHVADLHPGQRITLWGEDYAGTFDLRFFYNFDHTLDFKQLKVRYDFKGAIQGENYLEGGVLGYAGKGSKIFNMIHGLSSELRGVASDTDPYYCVMTNMKALRDPTQVTKVLPGERGFLIHGQGNYESVDANEAAKAMFNSTETSDFKSA